MKVTELTFVPEIDDDTRRDSSLDIQSPRNCTVGRLVAITQDGVPLVLCAPHPKVAIPARTVIDLHGEHVGCDVLLAFADNNHERPIIVGRLLPTVGPRPTRMPSSVEIEADGERVIVSAADQLVLKCGKASVTLTRAGKVLISGTYVSSHSTGVNRVKGGSIQLN